MDTYEQKARNELRMWQREILEKPSAMSGIANGIQQGFNRLIPEKAHQIITEAIKNMIKAVLFGSEITTSDPLRGASLEEREKLVRERTAYYRRAGVVSGAGTGAGGFLLGLADFPILLGLKMKFLFETAALYGYNVSDYRERVYTLYIFQLAFSSPERRAEVYRLVMDWDNHVSTLPDDLNSFDWRTLKQQYRDYIDLAKMLQLVPGIGAAVGAYANYKLIDRLAETAMNAYRMRLLKLQ